MKIDKAQKVANIFNIFHDGALVGLTCELGALVLTVEIPYLAEKIDSKFSKFYVALHNTTNIRFFA